MAALRIAAVACILTALLSGCADNTAGGSLVYNGTSGGTDNTSFDCKGGSAEIKVAMNIGQGSVQVAIKDAAGKQVWGKSYSGPGNSGEDSRVTGAAGTWTIDATRTPPNAGFGTWSGNYAISVDC